MSRAASGPYLRACPPRRFPSRAGSFPRDMSELPTRLEVEDLQQNLRVVQDSLAQQRAPAELRSALDKLHPADVAYILEALPLEERQEGWDLGKARPAGQAPPETCE